MGILLHKKQQLKTLKTEIQIYCAERNKETGDTQEKKIKFLLLYLVLNCNIAKLVLILFVFFEKNKFKSIFTLPIHSMYVITTMFVIMCVLKNLRCLCKEFE